jgi:hypothetical protein
LTITSPHLLDSLAAYNLQIWPGQIIAYLLGIAAVFLAVRNMSISRRAIPAVLATFWLWVALFFWLPSAMRGYAPGYIFTAIFLVQGLLFLIFTWKPQLRFGLAKDASSLSGIAFILYALIGYPFVSALAGHIYPRISPFGLAPGPLVTFTFGLLLLAELKVPRVLLVIPFFYALSGFLWVSIGIWEDLGMIASGLLGAGLIWFRDFRRRLNTLSITPVPSKAGWSLDLPDEK